MEGGTLPPPNNFCPCCGEVFPFRRNKVYCSKRCRMTDAKRRERQNIIIAESWQYRRYRLERFDLATKLGDEYYSMKPDDRAEFLLSLIRRATSGSDPLLRDILTSRYWIYPDRDKRRLFPRQSSKGYKTVAQLANILCRRSPWRETVDNVIRGRIALNLDWVTNIEGDGLPTQSNLPVITGEYSPDRVHPFYTGEPYPFPMRRKNNYPADHQYLLSRTPASYWEQLAELEAYSGSPQTKSVDTHSIGQN